MVWNRAIGTRYNQSAVETYPPVSSQFIYCRLELFVRVFFCENLQMFKIAKKFRWLYSRHGFLQTFSIASIFPSGFPGIIKNIFQHKIILVYSIFNEQLRNIHHRDITHKVALHAKWHRIQEQNSFSLRLSPISRRHYLAWLWITGVADKCLDRKRVV